MSKEIVCTHLWKVCLPGSEVLSVSLRGIAGDLPEAVVKVGNAAKASEIG